MASICVESIENKKRFSVSLVFSKREGKNVYTSLNVVILYATNKEEALGIAITDNTEMLKTYHITNKVVLEII